ncbi:unnamed protein product [Discula destructiva]
MVTYSPPSSTSATKYQEFRLPVLGGWPEKTLDFGTLLNEEDGSILYETEYSGLLLKIIKLNDVSALQRYLDTNKPFLGPGTSPFDDPFWTAAAHGSTGALRALLVYWDATCTLIGHAAWATAEIPSPEARTYRLLHTACQYAEVESVCFLLNGPWKDTHADVHARDASDCTAILAAATSFVEPSWSPKDPQNAHCPSENRSPHHHLARCEAVMHLLLDCGASARDVILRRDRENEIDDTVLSLAIPRASLALVRRLINEGADVHAIKTHDFFDGNSALGGFGSDVIRGVTPLHIGSLYANTGGVQVLLDHGLTVDTPDSLGRLPIHWAAWGPVGELCNLEPQEFVSHITGTALLLLSNDPRTINAQDSQGDTALHYAAQTHGHCGTNSHIAVLKVLCEHGADAGRRGRNGQTPLHRALRGRRSIVLSGGSIEEPMMSPMIDLLLAHGASVTDADSDGNTPLHLAARDLAQLEAARQLLANGAKLGAVNYKGNTPLHEAADGISGPSRMVPAGELRRLVADNRVTAQDEMVAVLLHGVSEEAAAILMSQSDMESRSAGQLLEEKRAKWRDDEAAHRNRPAGRGGRERGRGT